MAGGSYCYGGDNDGDVGWENPDGFEKSGGEAEDGTNGGGGDGDEWLVMASVEMGGQEAEDWSCYKDSNCP